MVRMVVSLDSEDKQWLDEKARGEHVPMAEIIRRAIRQLREQSEERALPLEELLQQTSGIWDKGDGLAYQRKLRDEWQPPR